MVALQRGDQRVPLTRRADNGSWCLPAGAAEPGGSFATAVRHRASERYSRAPGNVTRARRPRAAALTEVGTADGAGMKALSFPSGTPTASPTREQRCFGQCAISRLAPPRLRVAAELPAQGEKGLLGDMGTFLANAARVKPFARRSFRSSTPNAEAPPASFFLGARHPHSCIQPPSA